MENALAQPIIFQPMMIPMMYYLAPAPTTSHEVPAGYAPEVTVPDFREEDNEKSRNSTSDDEVYYVILEAYEQPGAWGVLEEGLCVRATKLPTIENCYVEKADEDYATWGTSTDCERVLGQFSLGFVLLDLSEMEARIVSNKHTSKVLRGLKIALRELRTYPNLIGLASFEDGKRCFIEVAWKEDPKKPPRAQLEDELLLAIVRRKQVPITFW